MPEVEADLDPPAPPLRYAVAIPGTTVEAWQARCLDLLDEGGLARPVLAAVGGGGAGPAAPTPARTLAPALERWHARVRAAGARRPVDVSARLAALPRRADGAADAPDLDFVLAFGGAAVPAELAAARHGIWRFDFDAPSAAPPFLAAYHDGEHLLRARLLATGGAGAATRVVHEGVLGVDARSFPGSRDAVLLEAATWPARACRLLARGLPLSPRPSSADAPAAPPRSAARLGLSRVAARALAGRLAFAWARLARHPQWNVGIVEEPVARILERGGLDERAIRWFPLGGRGRFLSDPFGVWTDDGLVVLAEDFVYADGVGRIAALEWRDGSFAADPGPALDTGVHLSYPCLVQEGGRILCVPEAAKSGEIALWEAVEFPGRWEKRAVLVAGFAGVDPTVFRHDGRWWLTSTEKGRQEDARLWVWHAERLEGPWRAHAANPVKTDVRSARPAGAPFVHAGALYRPAQDCSVRYGWGVTLQRVERLTPDAFEEVPVLTVTPPPRGPFPHGRHTLTPVGEAVLVDGHRFVFVGWALLRFLQIVARDLGKKLGR